MDAYIPTSTYIPVSANDDTIDLGNTLTSTSNKFSIVKYWKIIVTVLIGAILISFLIWVSMKKNNEKFQPIETFFLPKLTTQHLFATDFDGLSKMYNQINLESCGVADQEDLIQKWTNSVQEWKPQEQELLKTAAQIADYAINTKFQDPFKSQLNSIPWQFGKTIHPYYLDGLPHTRGDIIFLTDKIVQTYSPKQLASLLLHEKSHVWQRKYPEEMQGWLENQGFTKVHSVTNDSMYRINPDEDGWIYQNKNQNLLGIRFRNPRPKDLYEVDYRRDIEHPYEQFAYRIQSILD
jgi:hypothetical protein